MILSRPTLAIVFRFRRNTINPASASFSNRYFIKLPIVLVVVCALLTVEMDVFPLVMA